MNYRANLQKLSNQENTEMDYILVQFLRDLKNKVKPLLIPSVEFIVGNFDRPEWQYLYDVNEKGEFFITTIGETILKDIEAKASYNITDFEITK